MLGRLTPSLSVLFALLASRLWEGQLACLQDFETESWSRLCRCAQLTLQWLGEFFEFVEGALIPLVGLLFFSDSVLSTVLHLKRQHNPFRMCEPVICRT